MSKIVPSNPAYMPVRATATPAQVTTLTVTSATGTVISGNYNCLPGDQPSTYGNTVYIWQNANSIPYNQEPLASFPIPGNTQQGSFSFPNLEIQIKSYILSFAVGPNPQASCSTAYVPATGSDFQYFQTTLDVQTLGSDSAAVNYSTPAGNLPQTNGDWIGLWVGAVASYVTAPAAKVQVGSDTAVGVASINNYPFLRGTTYTLAYFMGGWQATAPKQTTMAATFTFST